MDRIALASVKINMFRYDKALPVDHGAAGRVLVTAPNNGDYQTKSGQC